MEGIAIAEILRRLAQRDPGNPLEEEEIRRYASEVIFGHPNANWDKILLVINEHTCRENGKASVGDIYEGDGHEPLPWD